MLIPWTKLEAVNSMLAAVGEAPITNLQDDLAEAEIAISTLDDTSREIQSKGWSFNTELNREMNPTTSDEILLPVNTLRIDAVQSENGYTDFTRRYTNRGGKLYDNNLRTYTFTKKVTLDLVLGLDFNELTESAKRFIAADATQRYMTIILGSDADLQQMQLLASRALIQIEHEEDVLSDNNILREQPLLNFASLRTRIL
jgi:hypothetical protein